jgi:uncharacterized membrane protein YeiH
MSRSTVTFGGGTLRDILLDKRRLYEWALEPLFAIGRKLKS